MLATALAQAVHCGDGAGDFCGECVNCTRIADGNHPDVRVIEPLAGKKEISIQQVREFERELNYRSFTGKRKIVIVDPATLMNLASQNALLKTLEEPPQDSLIILIASSAGGLLPTVRSRCLRVSFAPLARSEVAQYLRTKQRMTGDDVEFVAAMSMGSIGAAMGLDKEAFVEKRRVWAGMVGALKAGDYQSAVVAAEVLAGNRDDALKFLSWAQSWYRDLLVYGVTGDGSQLVNLDMLGQIEQQASPAQSEQRIAAVTASSRAAAAIQRNLNRRMVLEKILVWSREGTVMSAVYLTTPLFYVNAEPHLGSTYTMVITDTLARYYRAKGDETFYLTGTDEHGDKIAQVAAEAKLPEKEFTDRVSAAFRRIWDDCGITYDHFIRTTDAHHVRFVQEVLQRVYDAGDIYFGKYGGLYCVGCERFYTEKELRDGKCPDHLIEPKLIEEENYFFRMGKYQDRLRRAYRKSSGFHPPRRLSQRSARHAARTDRRPVHLPAQEPAQLGDRHSLRRALRYLRLVRRLA